MSIIMEDNDNERKKKTDKYVNGYIKIMGGDAE